MSTRFINDGNIGSVPEYREFPNGNEEPRRRLRLNVRFDNPIPAKDGGYEDRGGFWATVDLWHKDAEHLCRLYQKGMRVLVDGRMVSFEGEDEGGNKRRYFSIDARKVAMLPNRIMSITMEASKSADDGQPAEETMPEQIEGDKKPASGKKKPIS
ncbi:single-stranded DNA-binding protein [Saezia sanguinis]|uniref:single-stranded DNA-binding protein n=1 Tax=Saezia sanguinis TaxID=1965230 RepID=UPI00305BB6F5